MQLFDIAEIFSIMRAEVVSKNASQESGFRKGGSGPILVMLARVVKAA